jgi:hypothetical protein
MAQLDFSDGISINTGGKPRKLELYDGLYVTGQGLLIPVDSHQEAEGIIRNLNTFNDIKEAVKELEGE